MVNSQQPVDDTTKSVDVVVRYFDMEFKPIILLILEYKRHRKAKRGIIEMEHQLFDYAQYITNSEGGLLRGNGLYGAVAYGTCIRVWEIHEAKNRYVTLVPFWGNDVPGDKSSYRDPGNAAHAIEIGNFLSAVKAVKNIHVANRMNPLDSEPSEFSSPMMGGYSSAAFTQHQAPSLTPKIQSHEENTALSHPQPHQSVSEVSYRSEDCVHAQFQSYKHDKVECVVGGKKKRLPAAHGDWQAAHIEVDGESYAGFVYRGKSGQVYYSWSLDIKGKGKGK